MKHLVIFAAILIGGCNEAPDGYRFERAEYDRSSVQLTVVPHATVGELRRAAARLRIDAGPDRDLHGFGIISPDRARCEVHVIAPAVDYQPQWIGHEVTHCLHGRWHR